MNKNINETDICKLYENLAAMSETRSNSSESRTKSEVSRETEDGSLITDTEREILMDRIAGQLGISDASKLPYVAELARV